MARTRTFAKELRKTGERTKAKDKGRRSVKRVDLIPIKEITFKWLPSELEGRFDSFAEDEEFAAAPELLEESVDFDDADLEIVDEDDASPPVDMVFDPGQDFSVLPGAEPEVSSTPEVLLENVYPLIISSGQNNRCLCRFEAPRWMNYPLSESDKKYVYILRDFLFALAGWFEDNKQDFLHNPTPENFVKDETCTPENCVVLQKGFLKQINARMPEHEKMTKSSLSRLYDKVWLFWPEWNMPLSAIFSDPYKDHFLEAWVVEGCFERYAQADSLWRDGRRYEGFSSAEIAYMAQKYDSLDPEEQLYLLCKTTKMVKEIDKIYQMIIERVSDGRNR